MNEEIRCQSCGRLFSNRAALAEHEVPCRDAKETTEYGRSQLRGEVPDPNQPAPDESATHQPEDRSSDQ